LYEVTLLSFARTGGFVAGVPDLFRDSVTPPPYGAAQYIGAVSGSFSRVQRAGENHGISGS